MPSVLSPDNRRHWFFLGQQEQLSWFHELTPGGRLSGMKALKSSGKCLQMISTTVPDSSIFLLDSSGAFSVGAFPSDAQNSIDVTIEQGHNIQQFTLMGKDVLAVNSSNALIRLPHNSTNWITYSNIHARQVISISGDAPLAQVTVIPQVFVVGQDNVLSRIELGDNNTIENQTTFGTGISRAVGGLSSDATTMLFAQCTDGKIMQIFVKGSMVSTNTDFPQVSAPMRLTSCDRNTDGLLVLTALGADKKGYKCRQSQNGSSVWVGWEPITISSSGLSLTGSPLTKQQAKEEEDLKKKTLDDDITFLKDLNPLTPVMDAVQSIINHIYLMVLETRDLGLIIEGALPTGDGSPDNSGGSGFVPPGGLGGVSDGSSGEDDDDDDDASFGLTGQPTKEFVLVRIQNATTTPASFSFRWGPNGAWMNAKLQAGQRWMYWVSPKYVPSGSISPSLQFVGSSTTFPVKSDKVSVQVSPTWKTPSESSVVTTSTITTGSNGQFHLATSAVG